MYMQQMTDSLIDRIINEEEGNVFAYLVDGPCHAMELEFEGLGQTLEVYYRDLESEECFIAKYKRKCVLGLFAWEFEFVEERLISELDESW